MRDRGEHRSALLKRKNARHIPVLAGCVPNGAKRGKPGLAVVNELSDPLPTVSISDDLAPDRHRDVIEAGMRRPQSGVTCEEIAGAQSRHYPVLRGRISDLRIIHDFVALEPAMDAGRDPALDIAD